MPTLQYESGNGGIETVTRDEFHTDKDYVVVGYDFDDGVLVDKVMVPNDRVVRIDYDGPIDT